jgi:hypothetical protein
VDDDGTNNGFDLIIPGAHVHLPSRVGCGVVLVVLEENQGGGGGVVTHMIFC